MKKLNKITLINWHYFNFEELNLETINFLTGKNASGKTTVIDAIQLLILGDTSGHFFNKSASDKSSRSLKGYLRCEIGDDEKGQSLYLRNNRFTSYIMGEFYDDKNNSSFTVGIIFDSYEDGSNTQKFFYLNSKIPENSFIVNNIPLSEKELRIYFLANYNENDFNFFETNLSYRNFIKEQFGNVSNSFFSLFKKAIPFSPINNIETFISEYVCEIDKVINIDQMQLNIRNYKQLEKETNLLEERILDLNLLNEHFNKWKESSESILTNRYIFHRGDLQFKVKELESLQEKVEVSKEDLGEYSLLIEKANKEIDLLGKEKDKLLEEKFSLDIYQKKSDFEEKTNLINEKIETLNNNITQILYDLNNYQIQWVSFLEKSKNKSVLKDFFASNNKMINEFTNDLNKLNDFGNLNLMNESFLKGLNQKMISLKEGFSSFFISLKNKINELHREKNETNTSLNNLKEGVKNYDPKLLLLKSTIEDRLSEKYNKNIKISILADLLEIKDKSWQNAIEGYLSSQKFYLIIDPIYFQDALNIYDKIKFEYNLFDYGLVDCEKVIASNPSIINDSLAEEVDSSNDYALSYINSLLGTLIKCDDVNRLRNYNRSITKSGMVYQGFVARQINKRKWENSYIGSTSFESEKNYLNNKLKDIDNQINYLIPDVNIYNELNQLEIINASEINYILNSLKDYQGIEKLKQEKEILTKAINDLDFSYIEVIENKIGKVTNKINNLLTQKDEIYHTQVKLRTELERIEEFDIPSADANVKEAKKIIFDWFEKEWIMDHGEPEFLKELEQSNNLSALITKFKNKSSKMDNTAQSLWENLISARSTYNNKYNTTFNPTTSSNKLFEEEFNDLTQVKLVNFKDEIIKAKEKAVVQFKDDFLAKLKSNFDIVYMQINDLNNALEGSSFGGDSYHFIIQPKSEYKEYYNMIMDPLLMEGRSIMDDSFLEKYQDTIDDLFYQISFSDPSLDSDMRNEIERNIEKFTDYRTYLKFDLIVTDKNGREQRLSKTLLKKSGGETQTPFYIAVLASFAQQYRVNDSNSNSIRLIVFDEAFSKMDSERIQESVRLLRNYGLQAILSAPPEKMSDILPLVDNTVCIVRDDQKSYIRNYQKDIIL